MDSSPGSAFRLVYHQHFQLHDPGRGHVEGPARLAVIRAALQRTDLWDPRQMLEFEPASRDQLAWVHHPAYLDLLGMMCDERFQFIGGADTGICQHSHYVATLAAGGVLAACRAVLSGTALRVFCAVRPPGHHAEADQALGFCLINHVALAAEAAIRDFGLQRVAIVDFDAHHGNGTQHAFAERADVLYVSLHERPESLPFPGTGAAAERGSGPGLGFTCNVPLDRYCRWPAYERAVRTHVLPALEAYRPELLLISAGFDALASDPVANLSLQVEDYEPLTRMLTQVADDHCGGRVVSVLEGGYDLSQLGSAVAAHVRGLQADLRPPEC